jgi:hypothetical protein
MIPLTPEAASQAGAQSHVGHFGVQHSGDARTYQRYWADSNSQGAGAGPPDPSVAAAPPNGFIDYHQHMIFLAPGF